MPIINRFEVTEDHLKLIRGFYITYDPDTEFGAPEVDPKRPYGNSDVYDDIGEILGIIPEDGSDFSERQQKEMLKLHKETATALQVIIHNGAFETGVYQRDNFRWYKI